MRTKKARKPDKQHVWLSEELGTSLVAESAFNPDLLALCRRYNVSSRTLERWRAKVAEEERLGAMVAEKRKAYADVWEVGLREAARELIAGLMHHAKLAQSCTTFDPAMVHKLAGALKIVSDAATTRGILVQPPPTARKGSQPAKDAGVGDRTSGGAIPAGRDGAAPAGAATPAPTGGDPVH